VRHIIAAESTGAAMIQPGAAAVIAYGNEAVTEAGVRSATELSFLRPGCAPDKSLGNVSLKLIPSGFAGAGMESMFLRFPVNSWQPG
jgi:hypothetical protein